ncbi:class I SAM-dependent methyltransferase [Phenylobacterium sp.]|uniref:class I SAM-dependent methyltransferase n=1 Tax=Phenylobacterium sp. TaxID=1871053 RepID=UPI0011F82E00|nr:class I SAM-dependent methyltransferase [Phenylobacterium sp.]THD63289.1 MAG: class I SAM-dependent methyltransferase [Phenylobacterium sp.]
MATPNTQYNVAKSDSLPVKIAAYQRRRMFDHFLSATGISPDDTLLDVGATSERTYEASNYVEAWYPHKAKITALGIDDASFLEEEYPGVRFVKGDGRELPFQDGEFDVVHSSAVLEHVGSFDQQVTFIAECARVAAKSVYLTTPNRWFPIEFHTVLPLVHWLPKSTFRSLMRKTGRGFFAEESNLNLMGAADLRRAAAAALGPRGYRFKIATADLAGWPSNLLLVAHRDPVQSRQ